MHHHLSREEIEAILNGRAFLIDVRSEEEYNQQKCPSAIHWDVRQMTEGRFPKIPREARIFVFCRSGSRSATAQRLLGGEGFSDAHDIGGIESVPPELW